MALLKYSLIRQPMRDNEAKDAEKPPFKAGSGLNALAKEKKVLNAEQKTRLKNLCIKTAVLIAIGIAYGVFYTLTGIGIPCLLTLITGGYCPGCGITRMFLALARLDIAAAFQANMLLMILIPLSLPFIVRRSYNHIKFGEPKPWLPEKIFVIAVFAVTVAFWILRNTEAFAFLAP